MRKRNWLITFVMMLVIFAAISTVNAAELMVDNGGIITSSQVIQTKTGTGPWDANDDPGNDTSEDNNIVRSFDQVTWTIENTMAVNGTGAEGYNGGKIYFEAKLPSSLNAETAMWKLDSMAWIENAKLSADKMTLTGYYEMDNKVLTVPGKQSLVFVVNIMGAANGTELQPDIKVWLDGNSEADKVNVKPDVVTISAAPKYNIYIARNSATKRTVDLPLGDGETITGRVYGYSFLLQLVNDSVSKGLKGIEYPKGDITFDLDLLLERVKVGSSITENITEDAMPLLFNYAINNGSPILRPDYKMNYFTSELGNDNDYAPYGLGSDRKCSIYKSGDISIVQEGSKLKVKVSNYGFDGTFPIYHGYYTKNSSVVYKENIGCFSCGYMHIIVPDTEASTVDNANYYFKVTDTNFKATSMSGVDVTTQKVTNDDSRNVNHVRYSKGSFSQDIILDNTSNNSLGTSVGAGDGHVSIGQEFLVKSYVNISINNDPDDYIRSVDRFLKFDGSVFEIVNVYGEKIVYTGLGNMTFNAYFATKKDGTTWTSQEEMNNADVKDCDLYTSYDDIPEGKVCVGVFFESTGGYLKPQTYLRDKCFQLRLKAKENAVIGQTYGFTEGSKYWREELDREIYSRTKLDSYDSYPTADYTLLHPQYVKTEYNAAGNMVTGTHDGGTLWGNSVLIIGATQKISQKAIDVSNVEKVNYDLTKNESKVKFQITSSITNSYYSAKVDNVTVKYTDTLPVGLKYIPNSSSVGEPEITNNPDGTTTLVWEVSGISVGKKIPNLTFEASIDEETPNGVQYQNKVVMSVDDDRIGNTLERDRTSTYNIQIINLASHRLYKTVSTPVIERNGEVHFTVSYKNNTDDVISNFQLLDILPYIGDGRGTDFHGTYTVDRLEVSIDNGTTVETYYTNNTDARNADCKDENLVDGWTKATSSNILAPATAFAIKGSVGGQGTVAVDIYLKTKDNLGLDKYVNNTTTQVYTGTEKMVTSNVLAQVIQRSLEGTIWYDVNANGTMDANEPKAKDILVTLTDETRKPVKDINGNVIPGVKTDANGHYKFVDLPKGNYLVNVTIGDETYTITRKEVGTISSVNSKFNEETGETDEITKLNTVDLPELTVSNQNAGLVKKPTQVIVNYKEVGTETVLNPQITIDGRIDDEYATEDKLTDINNANGNKYEFVETTGDAVSGTMVEDTLEVTYWYQKKMAEVEVNYLEVGTNKVLSTKVTTQDRVDADYTTANKLDEINAANGNKYEFVETTGAAVNGKYTVDKQVINYWYQKKETNVIVNYKEVGTETELSPEVEKTGRVDDPYTTENKLTEINNANSNKYEYVRVDGNANGNMAVDTTYVTYWYQKKATNVIVKYVDKNTNEEIYNQAEITGRIDDDYETVNELDNINKENSDKYEFVESTNNTEGTMTEDTIEVIYYYQKKPTNVIVKYVDADTNEEIYDQAEITGRIDDDYTTVNELDNINKNFDNKYTFVRVTDNAEGKMTADTIEVTYYYQKKEATIEVNYLEKGTETVLLDKVTKGGKVDADYTTENKLTEINAANGNKYEFVETTGAATEGKYTVDKQVINYYYQKKPANVIVRYKEVGTEATLSPEVEKTGRVDDAYTTENKLTDINAANNGKYEYVKVDGNANGNMAVDTTYVTYWYQKKATNVIVKYVDVDTQEEIYTKATITGRIDDDYTTVNELDNINAKFDGIYAFTESTNNTAGKMTEGTIEVIYYYQKQLGDIEVNYVELDTNKVLAEKVESTGKIDSAYTTINKIDEINGKYNNSYDYVKVTGTPEGTYKKEKQVITYYYTKKGTKVIVDYVDADTNESIYDTATINGKVDDPYTTVNELDNINEKHNNKYEFVSVTNNKDGNMTLDTIHVIYTYSKKIAEVEVLYKEVGSEIELADKVTMSGKIDSKYETTNKLDEINETYDNIYEFVEVKGKEVGTYTLDKQTITYYYDRKPTNVIVNYVDIETEEKLAEESEILGKVNDNYVTGDMIEIINREYAPYVYELVEISGEANGQMALDTTYVTYYYKKLKSTLVVKFVDEEGNELIEKLEDEDYIGNEYTTKPAEIEGYELIKELMPKNQDGEYVEEETEVVYVYRKIPEPEPVETSDMSFALILVVAICSFYGIKKVKFSKNK